MNKLNQGQTFSSFQVNYRSGSQSKDYAYKVHLEVRDHGDRLVGRMRRYDVGRFAKEAPVDQAFELRGNAWRQDVQRIVSLTGFDAGPSYDFGGRNYDVQVHDANGNPKFADRPSDAGPNNLEDWIALSRDLEDVAQGRPPATMRFAVVNAQSALREMHVQHDLVTHTATVTVREGTRQLAAKPLDLATYRQLFSAADMLMVAQPETKAMPHEPGFYMDPSNKGLSSWRTEVLTNVGPAASAFLAQLDAVQLKLLPKNAMLVLPKVDSTPVFGMFSGRG